MIKYKIVRDDYEEMGTDLFIDLQIKYHNILSGSHITRDARDQQEQRKEKPNEAMGQTIKES